MKFQINYIPCAVCFCNYLNIFKFTNLFVIFGVKKSQPPFTFHFFQRSWAFPNKLFELTDD